MTTKNEDILDNPLDSLSNKTAFSYGDNPPTGGTNKITDAEKKAIQKDAWLSTLYKVATISIAILAVLATIFVGMYSYNVSNIAEPLGGIKEAISTIKEDITEIKENQKETDTKADTNKENIHNLEKRIIPLE